MPWETATRAAFLFQPVAKALDCWAGNTPTSGMPMPAFSDSSRTVSSSHFSPLLEGCLMICARVDHLAMGLDISSEINEPAKPNTALKISRLPRSSPVPLCAR